MHETQNISITQVCQEISNMKSTLEDLKEVVNNLVKVVINNIPSSSPSQTPTTKDA